MGNIVKKRFMSFALASAASQFQSNTENTKTVYLVSLHSSMLCKKVKMSNYDIIFDDVNKDFNFCCILISAAVLNNKYQPSNLRYLNLMLIH